MTREIPILETERLLLRGHGLSDYANCAAMWADSMTTRYIGGKPLTRQQSWARLLNYIGHWSLMGFGYWAVEEKSTGQFVGEIGFADSKRDFEPSIEGIPELGWILIPSSRGKGYATEGVRAATTWGDAHLDSQNSVCLVDPENLPSLRVAAKCGYQETLHTVYGGGPIVLFTRLRL
jgi:RimJ/RimL family protein N-acetyltransferase